MDPESQQPEVIPQTQTGFQTTPQPRQQPIITEEPLFTAPSPIPTEQPKPKKSHKAIIYAIVAVLLVGGGIAGGWQLFGRDDGTSSQQTQTSTTKNATATKTTPAVATLQPEDVTNKIKTTLAAQYTLVDPSTVTKLQSGQISVTAQASSPAYKTTGYNFYNTYAGGSTLYLTSYYVSGGTLPTAAETAIRTEVAKIYADFGMQKTTTYGSADASDISNVYIGKGLICTIDDPSNAGSPTTASCGLITAYKDAAAKVKPFADVITDLSSSTILSVPAVKNSSVSGYQTASINSGNIGGMSGHADLFYRKTSGSWQYFVGTQSEIGCEKYTTTDLKNAYKGEACWDTASNKDSTVQ